MENDLINFYDDPVEHYGGDPEFQFYNSLAKGDIQVVKREMQDNHFYKVVQDVQLSSNPLQSLRYHYIVTIALCARYCILNGMPLDEAYEISDRYIMKMDKSNSVEEIIKFHDAYCMEYVTKMANLKNERQFSQLVSHALNYIYLHVYETIKLEDIAHALGVSPEHLSRQFRIQTKTPIHQYILMKKIDMAKELIRYSEHSMTDISNLLAFSSQSHFISVFKKLTGLTPKQYRDSLLQSGLL